MSRTVAPRRSRPWWPRAALRRDEDAELERKVTWLELFFDLVFVVVLSRLAHDLAHHVSVSGLVDFALLFAAVFWVWNAYTYYTERFESGGLEQRAFVFAAMVAVALIAVWSEGGLGDHYRGFATAYLLARSLNMVQWVRAGWHVPEFRPVAARFVAGFVVVAALVVVAGALDGGARRVVFASAVLIDIATPATTLGLQARLPRLSTSKFPERFGLFTIIVLGESVVAVITGVSELNEAGELGAAELVDGGLGMAVGIGLWWVYFDFVARRPPRARVDAALAWVYLHLVTLGAITVTGAAIRAAVVVGTGTLGDAHRLLLGGSVAAALVGMAALELTLHRDEGEPTHPVASPAIKFGAGLVVAAAAAVDGGWTATALLATLVAALAVPAVYGAVVWYGPANVDRIEDRPPMAEVR